MINQQLIAHVHRRDDGNWDNPHDLVHHLLRTAGLAQHFASKFNSAEWGKAAGLAHDVGKARPEWQNYLRENAGYGEFDEEANLENKTGKVPHAIHGARLVEELYTKVWGRSLSYVIAGHHAGLPDWSTADGSGRASLHYLLNQVFDANEIDQTIVELVGSAKPSTLPWKFTDGLDMSLWIRMLYSCLVDADFLDTESYMDSEKNQLRGGYFSLSELQIRFNNYIDKLDKNADHTKVNKIRRNIRDKCLQTACKEMGIFSLSVPTGGGKTLSSLAFALQHAIVHNLDRIIYVIPYTSIIEQNADVFRVALGDDQVVEHHSNLDEADITPKTRLASENWDAPVIVTTSVQFFESLFAARSGRCRKLHNIAKSVVVLDEAQLMPVEHLAPILQTMQLLTDHYQVSFVISTATQPALQERVVNGVRFPGIISISEIIGEDEDVNSLYESLKRYHINFPNDLSCAASWEEIAEELQVYKKVLCVVSDRKSCRELHALMPKGTFHLSALMCGQHRSETINVIKQQLKTNQHVRVISTQLVEAGVDFDFPVVYRAFAGLDSIAQAGGRCNREGKMDDLGKVVVFIPPRKAPLGILRKAAETTMNIVMTDYEDPLSNQRFGQYFKELYWKANSLDRYDIISLLDPRKRDPQELSISFRTAAGLFRIIDDSMKPVLVPYGEGGRLIAQLRFTGPDRNLLRQLQRYVVNVYPDEFAKLLKRGSLYEVHSGVFALSSELDYSEDIGLLIDPVFDPDQYTL